MASGRAAAYALILLLIAPQGFAQDVRWNGFLNIVGGVLKEAPTTSVSDNGAPDYDGYDKDFTFDRQSSAGLQAMHPLDDRNSVTLQLFADGADNHYDVNLKWLYLTHFASDNSTFRVGRIGSPVFYYSDFLNVGYAYHWSSPPSDVYNYDTTMTGIDYIYQNVFDDHDWSVEIMTGTQDQFVPATGAEISMRNVFGGVFTFSKSGWLTFRAALFQMDATFSSASLQSDVLIDAGFDAAVTQGLLDQSTADAIAPVYGPLMKPLIDDALAMENEPVRFAEFALRAEKGRWLGMVEWSTFRTDTYTYSWLESWFATVGMRVDKALYHFTYARYDQHLDDAARADYNTVLPDNATTEVIVDYFARQIRATPAITFASRWCTGMIGVSIDTSINTVLKFELLHFDQQATTPTETAGIGHNMLFRTALNVTF